MTWQDCEVIFSVFQRVREIFGVSDYKEGNLLLYRRLLYYPTILNSNQGDQLQYLRHQSYHNET